MLLRPREKKSFETVQLQLYGPKSMFIGTKLVTTAELNETWYNLFNAKCGLQVSPTSGLFVSTLNYTHTSPKVDQGWCAQLHDKIVEFVNKFERKRKRFSVRICHADISPSPENSRGSSSTETPQDKVEPSSPTNGRSDFLRNATTSAVPSHGPSIVIPLQGLLNNNGAPVAPSTPLNPQQQLHNSIRPKRKAKSEMRNVTNGEARQSKLPRRIDPGCSLSPVRPGPSHREFHRDQADQSSFHGNLFGADQIKNEDDHDESLSDENELSSGISDSDAANVELSTDSSDDDSDVDDDDNASVEGLYEKDELLTKGIKTKNIKPLVQERVDYIDNDFYVNVKNEMRKLKKTKQWDQAVARAPLSCFFLQGLLGE